MANLDKSSLMSRLFPQEDGPAGHAFSNEDFSSSTLFTRISSPGLFSAAKAPFISSSSSRDDYLYTDGGLFRACFATFGNGATNSKSRGDKDIEEHALTQLREAFAQEGVELHTSVAKKLSETHQDITSQICDFSKFSSSIVDDMDELYENLSYPLSTTMCHSNTFRRATIEAHLTDIKERLKKAENELCCLENEWQESVCLEEKLRQELLDMERNTGLNEVDHSKATSMKEDIERIVADNIQALQDIEEAYKEGVQAQTMKMMQAMLVD
ncbi:hypothetical protein V8C37DRAFT_400566 [Trichoderma ceciliae]